jgi:diphthine-ammonia ligase
MSLAVLWTGGKDSALALQESKDAGIDVQLLVTFAPPHPAFRAHPLNMMSAQAESLGIPHRVCTLSTGSADSYTQALTQLHDDGIDTVVTGDIAEVDGYPNWIEMCCQPLGIRVMKPLWHRERIALCEKLFAEHFDVVVSCVNTRMLSQSFLGRTFDRSFINDIANTSVDLCGENGEFHTMTMNMPAFSKPLALQKRAPRNDGSFAYLDWTLSS